MIYFDSAGSFPVLDEVKEKVIGTITSHYANPSSDHAAGVMAADGIEKVREQIAEMIGATVRRFLACASFLCRDCNRSGIQTARTAVQTAVQLAGRGSIQTIGDCIRSTVFTSCLLF